MSRSANIDIDGRPGYLATPIVTDAQPGPWPAVVVVHDILGLSDDVREQADWLAAAGYLAAVPDLYGGHAAVRCVKAVFGQLAEQQGPVFDHIDDVRARLAESPDCTGVVGVIGYCMGGAFALLLAGRPGWSAAAVNYGLVPPNVADVLAGACPLVASYGARDWALRGAADTLRQAAGAAGVVADVKEYPPARHGFINRSTVASPLTTMLKVVGVGYDHDSAADAKRRILSFFQTHLHEPAGAPGVPGG